jgi:putative lipoic acid-binding regulatory protein
VILQNTLIGIQQSDMNNNLLNSIQVLAPTNTEDSSSKDLKRMYFSLSVNTVFENKDQIQSLYNTLMNDFSNSSIIKKQVELWKQNIHRSLNANEENITRYNSLIKQNQDYLKELSSQKRLSGIDGQTLLSSYISRIDSYQKKIFSLEDLQRDLKLKFESLQPNLSEFGSMIYQKNSKLSKAKILVIGFVLSIFMAFIAVFMKIVIRKAMIEYKDSKDSN